jgi:hypothetical protein
MQAQVRLAIGYIFNLSLLCSCATVDKAQIKQIRSLAIIGVDGRIVEDGSQLSQHLTALNDQQFGLRMYQALIAQMQQHMKWKFVSLDKVKAAKTMQKAVSEKVNSILTAISMKDKFITIPGILQPTYAGYKLNDRNWRKKIMQELKVDSLLFLSFEVRQELPWYAPGFAQSLLSSATFNAAS